MSLRSRTLIGLSISLLISTASFASPASADEPGATQVAAVSAPQGVPTGNNQDVAPATPAAYANTAVVKVTNRYVLPDFGISGSKKPGLVTDIAHTFDPIWGWTITPDLWERYGFAGGPYGTTYKDEWDTTVTADKGFSLSFCTKGNLEISGAHYALAPLDSLKGDVLEFYAEPSCSYELGGGVNLTVAVRPMEVVGLNTAPNDFLVRFRAPITFTLPFLWNAHVMADPIDVTVNTTPNGGNHSSYRPSGSIAWDLTDTLSLKAEVQATNHTGTQFGLGLVTRF